MLSLIYSNMRKLNFRIGMCRFLRYDRLRVGYSPCYAYQVQATHKHNFKSNSSQHIWWLEGLEGMLSPNLVFICSPSYCSPFMFFHVVTIMHRIKEYSLINYTLLFLKLPDLDPHCIFFLHHSAIFKLKMMFLIICS